MISRPLSSKSLKSAEAFARIYIWELSKSSSYWVDFCDDVIFGNSRLSSPESNFTLTQQKNKKQMVAKAFYLSILFLI